MLMMWKTVVHLLCIAAIVAGLPAAGQNRCAPPEEALAAILESDTLQSRCGRTEECLAQRRAILDAVLELYSEDVFLHRKLQDLYRPFRNEEPSAERREQERFYTAQAEAHADKGHWLYLAGRVQEEDGEALAYYQRAVGVAPDSLWGHLGVAHLRAYFEEFEDLELARKHIDQVLEFCPARLDLVFAYSRKIKDDEYWRRHLEAARAALEGVDPALYLDSFSAVWQIAFRVLPPDRFEGERNRVAKDLERLAAIEGKDTLLLLSTLKEGYGLTQNTEALEAVDRRLQALEPCSMAAISARLSQWRKDNPQPDQTEEGGQEALQEWHSALLRVSDPWAEQCPDAFSLHMYRMQSAAAARPPVGETLERSADRVLAIIATGTVRMGGTAAPLMVADTFLRAEHNPARAFQLAEAGWKEQLETRRQRLEDPDLPEERRQRAEAMIPLEDLSHQIRLARIHTRLGHWEEAQRHLEAAREQWPLAQVAAEGQEQLTSSLPRWHGTLREAEGEMAQAQGRPLDAALFFRTAAGLYDDEKLAERAASLWSQGGGSAEAWSALTGRETEGEGEKVGRWETKDEPLPTFDLKDLQGQSWQLAQLEGKTVLANIWATWCGPCRQELPFVEELHRQLKDREDLVVLTLNVDFNPGLIGPYMEKEGYSFPVLLAADYVEEILGSLSIPRNWLVAGDGTWLREQIGFDPSEEKSEWIAAMTSLLEETARRGAEAAATAQ